ncbi:MAG: 2-oxoacid:acceptor oxidoreductase family protein [Firmicutes bacterium]|nr:2-oxoacid:acceptor oxidoreductase family protein [Bacillota bacterium]
MAKKELRFSGSGGQGVIMATIILAEAAYEDKLQAVQCQSYGPEARGGLCKAECIIDDKPIMYTKVILPNLLLALTQESLDKYAVGLQKDAIVLVDSSINVPESVKAKYNVVSIPILESADEVIKNHMSANIISVGAVNELLNIASKEAIEEAVLNHVPKGTEELNLKALNLGAELVRNYQKQ